MQTRSMTTLRTLRNTCAALGLAALAGCQGHGQYTQKFRDTQAQKMAGLKAATSWDMAHQQYLAGDLKKALKTVEESILLSPEVAKSHTLRGRILLEQGSLESALLSFETAIELNPDFVDGHYFRGIVLERFTRFDQALEEYRVSASLDETNPQYVVAWAEMLIELDRLDEAWSMLEEHRARFEHNAGVRQTLGHIAMMRGDTLGAIEHFREATLLAPDDDGLTEDLARAQMSAGEYAQADQLLRRILDGPEGETRRDLKHLRAQCLAAMDQLVGARELLVQLTTDESGASDAPAWYALGRVCLQLNDRKTVRDAANRLVAISPTTHHGHLLMALFQEKLGDTQKAIQTLDRAVQLSQHDPEPALVQAVLLERVGRHEDAVLAAQHALSIDPTSQEAMVLATELASGSGALRLTEVPVDE